MGENRDIKKDEAIKKYINDGLVEKLVKRLDGKKKDIYFMDAMEKHGWFYKELVAVKDLVDVNIKIEPAGIIHKGYMAPGPEPVFEEESKSIPEEVYDGLPPHDEMENNRMHKKNSNGDLELINQEITDDMIEKKK